MSADFVPVSPTAEPAPVGRRRFFRILWDEALWDQWLLGLPAAGAREVSPWDLVGCRWFQAPGALSVPVKRAGKALEFSFGAFDVPYVTRRVGELIEAVAPGEVQRIPVDVEGASEHYEILNVLHCLDCIDKNATTGDLWTPDDGRPEKVGQYFAIYTLKLRDDIEKKMIFRVAGWETPLIVADELKVALVEAVASGLTFQQL